MAIKTKDELLEKIRLIVKDDASDDVLSLIEDISDTISSNNGEDWQRKYEDNDRAWRERYRDRFYNTEGFKEDFREDVREEIEEKKITYESLFNEERK